MQPTAYDMAESFVAMKNDKQYLQEVDKMMTDLEDDHMPEDEDTWWESK